MKFIRYEKAGKAEIGILNQAENGILPLSRIFPGFGISIMQQVIEGVGENEEHQLRQAYCGETDCPVIPVEEVKLLAPIERPVHDILCVGVNYQDHREEAAEALSDFQAGPETVYFTKRAIRILGSGEAIKARPDLDEQLDYEVELAVIIGKEGKDIPAGKAEEYIFGYSVFNDISSRRLQNRHGQWFKGKSLDTYTAMGPVVLHKSALPFPVEADVKSFVNGEKRQDSNTRFFLADIPKIIEDLSKGMTLEPGDIIATGTPAGVGMGSNPPRFMKKGDEVVCEIPQIGRLINRVE
nr:fumarylacetoacetate hydrolase family protein [uncultured Eisenbergiella sp.]